VPDPVEEAVVVSFVGSAWSWEKEVEEEEEEEGVGGGGL